MSLTGPTIGAGGQPPPQSMKAVPPVPSGSNPPPLLQRPVRSISSPRGMVWQSVPGGSLGLPPQQPAPRGSSPLRAAPPPFAASRTALGTAAEVPASFAPQAVVITSPRLGSGQLPEATPQTASTATRLVSGASRPVSPMRAVSPIRAVSPVRAVAPGQASPTSCRSPQQPHCMSGLPQQAAPRWQAPAQATRSLGPPQPAPAFAFSGGAAPGGSSGSTAVLASGAFQGGPRSPSA